MNKLREPNKDYIIDRLKAKIDELEKENEILKLSFQLSAAYDYKKHDLCLKVAKQILDRE